MRIIINNERKFAACLRAVAFPRPSLLKLHFCARIAVLAFLLAGLAQADTILSNITASNFPILMTANSAQEIGWHQDDYRANLSVTVSLRSFTVGPALQSVNAFLTDAIGPGTTAADQIASTLLPLPSILFPATKFTLFSGLNLAPGNYYLTLAGTAPMGPGWVVSDSSDAVVAAPGVSFLGEGGSTNPTVANGLADYRPASTFFDIVPSSSPAFYGLTLQLDQASPLVGAPEPAELGLIGIGLWLLSLWTRRKPKA